MDAGAHWPRLAVHRAGSTQAYHCPTARARHPKLQRVDGVPLGCLGGRKREGAPHEHLATRPRVTSHGGLLTLRRRHHGRSPLYIVYMISASGKSGLAKLVTSESSDAAASRGPPRRPACSP